MKAGADALDDVVAEVQQVGAGGGTGAVGEGEGVAGGDGGGGVWREGEAFGEAGLLNEPSSGEFDLAGGCGPVGDFFCGDRKGLGDVGEGLGGDQGIFEEGSCGAGVGVVDAGVDDHGLAVADGADGVVDVEWGGVGASEGGEVGVGEVGGGTHAQGEIDARDDVAIAVGGIEDARAV